MSREVWGDEGDAGEYDHVIDRLLNNGWWTDDQAIAVRSAVKDLMAETIYENGPRDGGISVRFLQRMTILQMEVGLLEISNPLVIEAMLAICPERMPSQSELDAARKRALAALAAARSKP